MLNMARMLSLLGAEKIAGLKENKRFSPVLHNNLYPCTEVIKNIALYKGML